MIQWVECTRCSKWRILPPQADGSQNEIPDEWFCEMNTDQVHNTCEAPGQEYNALPVPVVPVLAPLPKKLPKSNDPESIRAVLKTLPLEELEEAYRGLDLERLLRDEFGDNLAAARASELVRGGTVRKPTGKKNFDIEAVQREIRQVAREGRHLIDPAVVAQLTH